MSLTLNIRELRKSKNLTLAQLAEMVGVSIPHISEIERGKKNLNNHLMERIADALQVEPSALIMSDFEKVVLMEAISPLSEEDRDRVLDFARALSASVNSE